MPDGRGQQRAEQGTSFAHRPGHVACDRHLAGRQCRVETGDEDKADAQLEDRNRVQGSDHFVVMDMTQRTDQHLARQRDNGDRHDDRQELPEYFG